MLRVCWKTKWALICSWNDIPASVERQEVELSVQSTRPPSSEEPKPPCLPISRLMLVHACEHKGDGGTDSATCTRCFARLRRVLCQSQSFFQRADLMHERDESLSCHVSVSNSNCGSANYRWLNVPRSLLSGPLPGRAASWKAEIWSVRWKMPLIVQLNHPHPHPRPLFFWRPQPPNTFENCWHRWL